MQNFNLTASHIQSSTVEDRIKNGYNFNIGDILSRGWEIFKKEWLTFSLYSLITLLITMVASFTIIGILFVLYPLTLGYFIGAQKVENGEDLSIKDMFGGFKKLPQLALLTLIPLIILFLVCLPFGGAIGAMASIDGSAQPIGGGAAMGTVFLMYAVLFVVGLILSLAMFFAPYLVFFGDYSPIEALKKSWALSMKQPLMIILFMILIGFITQLGALACGVGIFASMGFAYVCYYPAIKDVLFNDKNVMVDKPLV